jgi:hypothetical protein
MDDQYGFPNSLYDYQDGSFTATFTGFTTQQLVTVRYIKIRNLVTLSFLNPVVATSNAGNKNITGLPNSLWPSIYANFLAGIIDNGGNYRVGNGLIEPTIGLIQVFNGDYPTLFTSTGTCTIDVTCITYII